ncbi:MAG: hypothetical protein QGG36_33045 [Pirellulaceae bacterium]|jgi:hypothetical protein|nr:hypothetical protein [Pirellulaceae bacterium]MDP7020660.1 hypothetical protein [Pirellulaceae bacterium]
MSNPKIQWSIKTLLVAMLLVSAYFAGRYSLDRKVKQLEAKMAVLENRFATEQFNAAAATINLQAPPVVIQQLAPSQIEWRPNADAVERGMKAGEIEHRMRFDLQPASPLSR